MVNYVVAIPTYKRSKEVAEKTLKTLKEGGVPKSRIYLFVANKDEAAVYEKAVDPRLYNEIVVGKKGIANQRKFISKWFDEGQYIISIDDDVEELQFMIEDLKQELREEKIKYNNLVDAVFEKVVQKKKKTTTKEQEEIIRIFNPKGLFTKYKN